MKVLLYTILVLLLVPLQTTLLPHLTVWNIKPDVGLVAAALIGLFAGELEGLLVGIAIGWAMSIFSAGDLWLSVLTKGGIGLSAGLLGRQVSHVTATIMGVGLLVISLVIGLVAVSTFSHLEVSQAWWMIQSVVLPQACFDALVGAGLYGLLARRYRVDRLKVESPRWLSS